MCILTTQDAIWATALIGTLFGHVSKLLAIPTLDSRVRLDEVSSHLVLQPLKQVVFRILLSLCLLDGLEAARCHWFIPLTSLCQVLPEVHVTFDGSTRDD